MKYEYKPRDDYILSLGFSIPKQKNNLIKCERK